MVTETATYTTPSIYVVDDSDDDLLVLKRAFNRLAVINPLQHFNRAEQALAHFEREPFSVSNVGLVLLDINLPGDDGISFLKSLRAKPFGVYVPVVMFTTSDAPSDIVRSYQAGANAFVTKPVATVGFTEAVQHILAFWLRTARLPSACFEDF